MNHIVVVCSLSTHFADIRDAVLVMMSFHIFHVSFVSHANGKKLSSPVDRHTVRR